MSVPTSSIFDGAKTSPNSSNNPLNFCLSWSVNSVFFVLILNLHICGVLSCALSPLAVFEERIHVSCFCSHVVHNFRMSDVRNFRMSDVRHFVLSSLHARENDGVYLRMYY